MAAKERHKQKVKQRIHLRLDAMRTQEEALHLLIRDYIQQAQSKAEELLATEDTGYFMQHYGSVEQLLDRVNNTCELLSTTAEDLIENSELDVTVKPSFSECSSVSNDTSNLTRSAEILSGNIEDRQIMKNVPLPHRTSSPDKKQGLSVQKTSTPEKTHGLTVQKTSIPEKTHSLTIQKTSTPEKTHSLTIQKTSTLSPDKSQGLINEVKDTEWAEQKETSVHAVKATEISKEDRLKNDEIVKAELKALVGTTKTDDSKSKTKKSSTETSNTSNKAARGKILTEKCAKKKALTKSQDVAISKPVKKVIPSPVKKMLAHYMTHEEKEEVTTSRKETELAGGGDAERNVDRESVDSFRRNTSTPVDKTRDSFENLLDPHKWNKDERKRKTQASDLSAICKPKRREKSNVNEIPTDRMSSSNPSNRTTSSNQSNRTSSINPSISPVNDRQTGSPSQSIGEITTSECVIEQSSLPLGRICPVIVSDIVSPWCFCVQCNAAEVSHLMEQICTYMSQGGLHKAPFPNPQKGEMCLARFSRDMAFYRASILQCLDTSKEVEVLFVDYGNREKVKTAHLRKLPDRFYTPPMQAICCSLAEVMPSNKYMLWTEEDIMVFKQYVMNQQLNCVQACKCSTPGVPVIVRLFGSYPVPSIPGGHVFLNQLSIGEVLVNRGSVKYVHAVDQIGHIEKSGEGKEESLLLNQRSEQGHVIELQEDKPQQIKDVEVDQTKASENVSVRSGRDRQNTDGSNGKHHHNITKEGHTKGEPEDNEFTDWDSAAKQWRLAKTVSSCREENTADTDLHVRHEENTENNQIDKLEVITETIEDSEDTDHVPLVEKGDKSPDTTLDDSGTPKLSRGHGDDKSAPEKEIEKLKEHIAGSETMSSAGTTDLDSERSTDTGFQSTEVTFDLQLNPQGDEVMLAHVRSPTHFYVHMLQVGQTLDLLMKSLNKHFEKMNRRKLTRLSQTFVPVARKLCSAQFLQDNSFYRAVILTIRSDNTEVGTGKVYVHYIDFGDEEWLPKRRLFPLPPQYSSIPPLAIKCKLAFIKPAAGSLENEEGEYRWSDASTKAFIDSMGFEKTLHMQVVEGSLTSDCKGELVAGDSDEVLGVLLVYTNGEEEVCANTDLLALNHAVLDLPENTNMNDLPNLKLNEDLQVLQDWNPMEADFLSKRNNYSVDTEDAEMATQGYKSQSQERRGVCRYFSKGANCWRGDNCPYRHVQSDSAVPLERQDVYCIDNQADALPEVNSWVAAEVSTILTPGHFYILLPMGNKSLDGASNDDNMDVNANPEINESLEDLLTALNIECNKKSLHDRNLQLKAPGEIVAARFSQDRQWYRARVIQVTEEKVKVFYLDFGNTEWLAEEEVTEIKPEFLHLPFQAFESFLCNVEPVGEETWSLDAKNAFRDLVDGKTLVAHIRSRSWNGCLSLDLYDTTEEEDINVGERLIEKHYAIWSSFLTDSSCNGSLSGFSQRTDSDSSEVRFRPG